MKDKYLTYPETVGIIVNAEGYCLPVTSPWRDTQEYRPLVNGAWRDMSSLLYWEGEYKLGFAVENPWSWLK